MLIYLVLNNMLYDSIRIIICKRIAWPLPNQNPSF